MLCFYYSKIHLNSPSQPFVRVQLGGITHIHTAVRPSTRPPPHPPYLAKPKFCALETTIPHLPSHQPVAPIVPLSGSVTLTTQSLISFIRNSNTLCLPGTGLFHKA